MPTRRLKGTATSSFVPDNGGDHSGGGSAGGYVDDVFSTYLYEGDQSNSSRDIVNGVDLDSHGGMVWIKIRSKSKPHYLFDNERGLGKGLNSDGSKAESAYSAGNLTAFNSDGFTIGDSHTINETGEDVVSWTFRKAPNFFDCVTWTGTNGGVPITVPHNLGTAPGMVIVKETTQAGNWSVYHKGMGAPKLALLNQAYAAYDDADSFPQDPDDNNIYLGPTINQGDHLEFVAYLFAHDDSDESIIKCGSYTGNQNVDGPEVDLGFEPQWLLFKSATTGDAWTIFDTARGITNGGNDEYLMPNDVAAGISQKCLELTPTGFKITNQNSFLNESNATIVYMAIRRPNNPAEEFEPEELFAIAGGDALAEPAFASGFPVDMGLRRDPSANGGSPEIGSRLTGNELLRTNSTNAGSPEIKTTFDYMDGWRDQDQFASTYFSWMWRRVPGFMDVVSYDGDGQTSQAIPHNLSVAPEMMWIKARTQSYNWFVYHKDMTADRYLKLNELGNRKISDEAFYNTEPTEDVFTVGYDNAVNNNNRPYIAYLFASAPGISKVGSYEGNGSNNGPAVDCGFVPRLVMIKNIDGNGTWDWMDSVRGFDKVISLDNTNAQISDSLIEATTSGFKVTNGAGNVNNSGQTYIFYAIA